MINILKCFNKVKNIIKILKTGVINVCHHDNRMAKNILTNLNINNNNYVRHEVHDDMKFQVIIIHNKALQC